MLTLKRKEIINPGPTSTTVYEDIETGKTISITASDVSWGWIAETECPLLKKRAKLIISTYVRQGIAQHKYKGGFAEATETLILK